MTVFWPISPEMAPIAAACASGLASEALLSPPALGQPDSRLYDGLPGQPFPPWPRRVCENVPASPATTPPSKKVWTLAATTSITPHKVPALATKVATVSDVVTGMPPEPAAWKEPRADEMKPARVAASQALLE